MCLLPALVHLYDNQYQLLVVGASPDAAVSYDQVRYPRPTVLMLREERSGLSQAQRALCHQLVRIPMVAGAYSLNPGVAGSLLMYAVVAATKPP
jgi:tRNA G18 (ribose-2'-O)-methylase SpoU